MDKHPLLSRGVWLSIFTVSLGVGEIVRVAVESGDWSALGIVTLGLGILKYLERITRG
jgi:hypothetical protein